MGATQLNFDANMNNVVQASFDQTSKFIRMGVLNFFFYFTAIFTLLTSGLQLLVIMYPNRKTQAEKDKPDQSEPDADHKYKIYLFYFLMPIAAVLYHMELKRVCKKQEHTLLAVVKYLFFLVYYSIFILS
jgi:hypothetical protein